MNDSDQIKRKFNLIIISMYMLVLIGFCLFILLILIVFFDILLEEIIDPSQYNDLSAEFYMLFTIFIVVLVIVCQLAVISRKFSKLISHLETAQIKGEALTKISSSSDESTVKDNEVAKGTLMTLRATNEDENHD